jgi:hypothetical protein
MGKKQTEKQDAGWYQRTGVGKKTEKDPVEPGKSPLAGPTTNKLPTRGAEFPEGLAVKDPLY